MSSTQAANVAIVEAFIAALNTNDLDAAGELLAPDLVAAITNRESGADYVSSREAYLARVPDLDSAEYTLETPNILAIEDDLVLVMVVVRASRNGRELRNHSGQLARVREGMITHLWMVEALPEYSDEFWS